MFYMTAPNIIYNAKYYFSYYFRDENVLNAHCCINW